MYKTLGNGILSRTILIIISVLISINTFILILYQAIEITGGINNDMIGWGNYDWYKLYKSITDNGYDPNGKVRGFDTTKYKDGYLEVQKFKGKYVCVDGNHRHRVLLDIYGPDKIIDVIYGGITYKVKGNHE
tara:strand:- start:89 stop:484 length:396 start_codon:yes stop_codon:yes gene_type:complete